MKTKMDKMYFAIVNSKVMDFLFVDHPFVANIITAIVTYVLTHALGATHHVFLALIVLCCGIAFIATTTYWLIDDVCCRKTSVSTWVKRIASILLIVLLLLTC